MPGELKGGRNLKSIFNNQSSLPTKSDKESQECSSQSMRPILYDVHINLLEKNQPSFTPATPPHLSAIFEGLGAQRQ